MIQTDVLDYHQLGQPIRQESSQVQVAETSRELGYYDQELVASYDQRSRDGVRFFFVFVSHSSR